MSDTNNLETRNAWYQAAISKLVNPSKENENIIQNHLFHLKVNNDYVITQESEIDDLIEYLNRNGSY